MRIALENADTGAWNQPDQPARKPDRADSSLLRKLARYPRVLTATIRHWSGDRIAASFAPR